LRHVERRAFQSAGTRSSPTWRGRSHCPARHANFSAQPSITDIDEGSRDPERADRPGGNEDKGKPDDGSGDRGEGDHVESAEHVERELPAGNASQDP
jgi:hypothetical protein